MERNVIKIENLSIEEKVGQMLMVGMDIPDVISKVDDLILKYKVGGILLYKKNYNSYEEMVNLINYIKKINSANKVPIWIAIDQEGGRVNRMPKDFENLPSAYYLANYKKEDLVKEAGQITGEMLNKVGINFDFAPVLDIKRFGEKHAIGDRAFNNNKKEVAKKGITYMKELQNKKVLSVIKHFPGHGATTKDSHFILPVITQNIEELEKEDMRPFEEAIENGADAMLVSHLKIKGINKYPASMERRFIIKYIRKKYKFRGLIVTDDMRMKGVEVLYGKNRPVQKAFKAGNDIILFKYRQNDNIIEKIIKEVKKSPLNEARVNRSVKRILNVKEKYQINDKEISIDDNLIDNINKKIIEIKEKVSNND